MAEPSDSKTTAKSERAEDPLAKLQSAGFENMMSASTAWLESLSEMSAEVASFVADRIREDVKTQHKILHCKDVSELQQVQTEFIKKAVEQYQAETGKLVEMTSKAFAPASGKKD
jgi:hypothetical protein